jgi:uncharacterized protein YbaP (TraB family)
MTLKRYFWGRIIPLVAALVILAAPVLAGEKGEVGQKSFLWKVMSKSSTVYLLGSIHMARGDIYPLAPVIEKSFDKSAALALEADISKVKGDELLQEMMASATYPDGEDLKGHISTATYALLTQKMEKLGLPVEPFARMRPWFIAMTIESLEFLRLGFDPTNGIDIHFANEAEGKKRIIELESFDYQIRMLNGFSDRDQELFLIYTLKDLSNLRGAADELMNAWRQGDAKSMESLVTKTVKESPELAPVMERLYTRRNSEMSSKIDQLLKNRETVFVVVGAAHLVGEEGILQLLREKGYSVEQM